MFKFGLILVLSLFIILRQSFGTKKRVIPKVIVQYGVPRTSTTLQYHILCVMTAVVHEQEINSVGCHFNQSKSYKYIVIKRHDITDSYLRSLPNDSWIFMTSSGRLSSRTKQELQMVRQMARKNNLRVPYIANTEMVSKRGYLIAYEYQPIFGITDEKMKYILDYMQYWEILRRCCGRQMSTDWLNHLSPIENYTKHHDLHSVTYPACEMYVIGNVEKQLMNTYIYKRFAHTKSLRYAIGGSFDGTYCERCNDNIIKKRLQFNDNCL